MIVLAPLTEGEFSAFFDTVADSHATDSIVAGRWSASDASALAREELKRLLPANEKTPENCLFVLQRTHPPSEVGYLWFRGMTRATQRVAYLCQLYIHERFRRQGYGRQAMVAFENEALGRGYDALGLHVYATNGHAHRLYQTLGFAASSITMYKELRPMDA